MAHSRLLAFRSPAVDVDAALTSHRAYAGSINFSDYSLNKNRELGFITSDSVIDTDLDSTLASDYGRRHQLHRLNRFR
jgi:phosphatidylserine/phosphatidylglycerophosphate/cardiolipin synthase-like enzyme